MHASTEKTRILKLKKEKKELFLRITEEERTKLIEAVKAEIRVEKLNFDNIKTERIP